MKLILFDIDSTLVRIDRAVTAELTRWLLAEELDYHAPLEGYELHGKTDRQIIRELRMIAGAHSAEAASRARMERMIVEHWRAHLTPATTHVLPGVAALLEDLSSRRDVALGVLTGNLEPSAHLKLAVHELDGYFPFGAFGSDSEQREELPPIALERARVHHRHAFEFSSTLIVGDSHRDIECARVWGIRTLGVATGSLAVDALRAHGADAAVTSLLDRSYLDTFLQS